MKNETTKFRLFNIFIVLALMLTSIVIAPLPVEAREGGTNIFLPAFVGEPTPEINAAGSCYWSGSGRGSLSIPRNQTYWIAKSTTRNCRDINLHSSHCGVGVDWHIKGTQRRGYVWISPGYWQTVVTGLADNVEYVLKVTPHNCSNSYTVVHYAA